MSEKSPICGQWLRLALMLGVIGVAYYAGTSRGSLAGLPELAAIKAHPQPAPVRPSSPVVKITPVKLPPTPLNKTQQKLADLLNGKYSWDISSVFGVQSQMRGMVNQTSPDQYADMIAFLKQFPSSQNRDYILTYYISRLSASDPKLALELGKDLPDPRMHLRMQSEYLRSLVNGNPAQILSELAAMSPDEVPFGTKVSIIATWAKTNPTFASAAAASLPPGPERDLAFQRVAAVWATQNPHEALAWVTTLPGDNSELAKSVVSGAGVKAGMALVDQITDASMRNDIILTFAGRNAGGDGNDPAGAIDWLNKVATGATYDTAVTNIIDMLTKPDHGPMKGPDGRDGSYQSSQKQNILGAIALLDKINDPGVRQTAVMYIAGNMADNYLPGAVAWAQSQPEADGSQASALNAIATSLSKNDPAAAATFVQKSPDPSLYASAIPGIAGALAKSDPPGALGLVQSLPEGDPRQQALNTVLTNIAQTDFTTAWNYGNNMPEGVGRDSALANLVGVMANKDPAQATALLDKLPTASAQTAAMTALSATWIKQDPQAFTIWLNTLPAGTMRDTAIVQLVSSPQAAKDPAGVAQWTNTVSNPQTRAELQQKLNPTPSSK